MCYDACWHRCRQVFRPRDPVYLGIIMTARGNDRFRAQTNVLATVPLIVPKDARALDEVVRNSLCA